MPKYLLLTLYCLIFYSSYSQCKISIVGSPCLGNNLQFFCNSNNGTEHYWKFDSIDSLKLKCNTEWWFSSPGLKRISLVTKDANGNTCMDTAYTTIRDVITHMNIEQSRPVCATLIGLYDSSYIIQPLIGEQDSIFKWTYQWFENGRQIEKIINNSALKNFTILFNHNGNHPLSLKTETKFGCESTELETIFIPGPRSYFDTFIPHLYCTNEAVRFNNMSHYNSNDSCIWVWNFGDNQFANQYDHFNDLDTIWHLYQTKGSYHVTLNLYFSKINANGTRRYCNQIFPDTTGLNIDPVKLTIIDCGSTTILKPTLNTHHNVFPNPADQTLQITGANDTEIYLLNIYGSIVDHFYNHSGHVIDIGSIPEGLYLLTDKSFRVLNKVIIKR